MYRPTIVVYVLKDPDSQKIRYVGSAREVRMRMTHHRNALNYGQPLLNEWLVELKLQGKEAVFEVVESYPCDPDTGEYRHAEFKAHMHEKQLIQELWSGGTPLLNVRFCRPHHRAKSGG